MANEEGSPWGGAETDCPAWKFPLMPPLGGGHVEAEEATSWPQHRPQHLASAWGGRPVGLGVTASAVRETCVLVCVCAGGVQGAAAKAPQGRSRLPHALAPRVPDIDPVQTQPLPQTRRGTRPVSSRDPPVRHSGRERGRAPRTPGTGPALPPKCVP